MRIDVVTLFPELFSVITESGVTGRAHSQQRWQLCTWNPRDFTEDVHRTVDDRPYGGGPGMVMMAAPLSKAVAAAQAQRTANGFDHARVVLLAPGGKRFDQGIASALARSEGVLMVCGRYEGVDQRWIDREVDEQWSLGDFVLSGGELAAIPMIDAAARLIPGVLNHDDSSLQDSFQASLSGLLDSPHYTRPEVYDGQSVPAVLLSGNHANIAQWRRQQSLLLTARMRPDLIVQAREAGWLTTADERFLKESSPSRTPQ